MEIDQGNYIQKVRRIEIDRVKAKYGGEMIRLRIKGDPDDGSSITFALWGCWSDETVERKPVELIITDVDESQPEPSAEPELENEEPDV